MRSEVSVGMQAEKGKERQWMGSWNGLADKQLLMRADTGCVIASGDCANEMRVFGDVRCVQEDDDSWIL